MCSIIVCLFPKISSDISFRMTDTMFELVSFNAKTVSSYDFSVSLTWVIYFRVGEKSIYQFLRMIVTFL